eukprot:15244873-Heterocapsa_arctica.AAC.1
MSRSPPHRRCPVTGGPPRPAGQGEALRPPRASSRPRLLPEPRLLADEGQGRHRLAAAVGPHEMDVVQLLTLRCRSGARLEERAEHVVAPMHPPEVCRVLREQPVV